MPNEETLATLSSIIAGFGAALLSFRFEREVTAQGEGEPSWIPLIAAILMSSRCNCSALVLCHRP